jgi:hypothetical protein
MSTPNGYTQGIYIDGIFYDIPFVEIKRTADFLEKYAERNEAGTVLIETIGVYYNYTVKIGIIKDTVLYNKLFEHITDAKNRFHTVVLPNGMNDFTFVGYFSSIADEVEKVLDNGVTFNGLTWKMTSQNPTKTA